MSFRRLFNHSFSTFLHGYAIYLAYQTQLDDLDTIKAGMLSFAIAWLVMSYVLFLFRIQCGIPAPPWLVRIYGGESTIMYERLGIRIYRWILLHSPFRYANTQIFLKGKKGKTALEKLRLKMLEAEFAHVINLLVISLLMVVLSNIWAWLMLWNVVFNVYPIMLQRYHRIKMERILEIGRD